MRVRFDLSMLLSVGVSLLLECVAVGGHLFWDTFRDAVDSREGVRDALVTFSKYIDRKLNHENCLAVNKNVYDKAKKNLKNATTEGLDGAITEFLNCFTEDVFERELENNFANGDKDPLVGKGLNVVSSYFGMKKDAIVERKVLALKDVDVNKLNAQRDDLTKRIDALKTMLDKDAAARAETILKIRLDAVDKALWA